MTLEHVLAPLPPGQFMAEHFETSRLHIERNDPGHFAGLLAGFDLQQHIWRCSEAWGPVSLARAATAPADNPYATARPTPRLIEQAYGDGYTVVMNNLQQHNVAVATLCRAFEQFFLFRCNANLYLTAPHCQGLNAHYDDQDVFVLQLEGSKTWHVYEGGPDLPLEQSPYYCPQTSTLQHSTVRMRAGDVLYLPHGMIHDAHTGHERSLHLTVSVSAIRQLDWLYGALTQLAGQERLLRQAVPLWRMRAWHGVESDTGSAASLREVAAQLGAAHFAQTLDDFAGRLLAAAQRLPSAAELFSAQTALPDQADAYRIVSDQVVLLSRQADGCVLKFIGGQVPLEDGLLDAVESMCQQRQFLVREIAGGLGDGEKAGLVAAMVGMGLLEPVRQVPGHGPDR